MFKAFARTVLLRPVHATAVTPRFFSSSAAAQGLKINLAGNTRGFVQTLRVQEEGNAPHEFKTDAFKGIGGEDKHPDPIHYLFGSITGCQHITAVLVAKDQNVAIGDANIQIEADLQAVDNNPKHYPGFTVSSVDIKYELQTNASDEQFELLRETTESKCPIAQVFLNSEGLKFTSNWIKKPFN